MLGVPTQMQEVQRTHTHNKNMILYSMSIIRSSLIIQLSGSSRQTTPTTVRSQNWCGGTMLSVVALLCCTTLLCSTPPSGAIWVKRTECSLCSFFALPLPSCQTHQGQKDEELVNSLLCILSTFYYFCPYWKVHQHSPLYW